MSALLCFKLSPPLMTGLAFMGLSVQVCDHTPWRLVCSRQPCFPVHLCLQVLTVALSLCPLPLPPPDDDISAVLALVGKGRLVCPSLDIPNGGSVCVLKLTSLKMTDSECSQPSKSTLCVLGPWEVPLCLVPDAGLSGKVCLLSPFGAGLQSVLFL